VRLVVHRQAVALLSFLLVAASASAQQQGSGVEKPYLTGPGDQLMVQVIDVEEFKGGKVVRVDDSGSVTLPFIGRIEVSGMTLRDLEAGIALKLSKYVVSPRVGVTITERRALPVTVAGAVRNPGVQNVAGGKTLFEVLAMAGGVLPDAGYRIRLTRRVSEGPIPVAGAQEDAAGQYYVAEIPLKNLESGSSSDNVAVLPNDFISVPRAEVIYVLGDVKKTGPFPLADGQTVSVLQALGMAEGTLKTAAPSKASIKRRAGEDKVIDIPVDIDKIMAGKAPDEKMQAKDILVVPGSASKSALERTIDTILTIGAGAAIRLP